MVPMMKEETAIVVLTLLLERTDIEADKLPEIYSGLVDAHNRMFPETSKTSGAPKGDSETANSRLTVVP